MQHNCKSCVISSPFCCQKQFELIQGFNAHGGLLLLLLLRLSSSSLVWAAGERACHAA
jgi:hypothetical protein